MKRVLLTALLAVQLIVSTVSAFAQGQDREAPKYLRLPHRFQIFLEGGGAIATKPPEFKTYWNSAFDIGIGAGMSLLPWLEVNGGLQRMSFSNNAIETKGSLGYVGLNDVEGGAITTNIFYGSVRFLAVPRTRTNPYVEVAVGYYKTTAENLVIEDVLVNSMEDASGLSVAPSVGIQYALNEMWSSYAKYTFIRNFSDTFAPGDLLQPETGERPVEPGDEVLQSITVGVMVRF